MALSLVVHTGLAATFVYAVRPVPITFDLVNSIQVSLIEDYSDAKGTSNSNAVNSEEFSNSIQKFTQDDNLDVVNIPATDYTNDFDTAIVESQNTEAEQLEQRLDTSNLIESDSEPELAKNIQVSAVSEPKIEIVDKTAKSIPSSIESSFTAIPVDEKIKQTVVRKADADSNQSRSEGSLQAIEKHAFRNHPDSGSVLRNSPIEKPLPDSDTFLEFSDVDGEFEPWTNYDRESGSILQATLDIVSETAWLANVPQIGEDADELAGVATQPESDHDQSLAVKLLEAEISLAEDASVKSIEQLASVVDYDSQIQLLPQLELNETQTLKSEEISQPNVTTEIVSTPDESLITKFNSPAPNQPESDRDGLPAAEIPKPEVSRAGHTTVKSIEQLASMVDYDSEIQLLPQPELNEIQTLKSEEISQPNVTTEIVSTPDESLITKFNSPAPNQPESDRDGLPAAEIPKPEVSRAGHTTVKSIEQLASMVDYDSEIQLLPQPETDEIQTRQSEEQSRPNVTTEIVSTPDESLIAKFNSPAPNQPESDRDGLPAAEIPKPEVSRAGHTTVKSIEQLASMVDYDSEIQLLPQPETDEIQTYQSEEQSRPNVTTEIINTSDEPSLAKLNVSVPHQYEERVQEASLSVPRLAEYQKPAPDAIVASSSLGTTGSKPKNQSDQQNSVPSDFSSKQKLAIESSPNYDSQQLASLNSISFDTAPEYGIKGLSNPAPRYPYRSRVKGEQGKVILEVLVNREGRAAEITIAKSSGYSRLDKAARKAVKRWKFQPALKSGRKVQGVVRVPISFVLKNT